MTKNPLLIAAVGFLLAAFAFYHFGLSPKRSEAAAVEAKAADAKSRLDSAQALLQSNQAAKSSYRRSYATVVRLGKAVPADDDVRSLVVQLDHAARRSHIDFQSIEVGGEGGGASPSADTAGTASTQTLPPGASVGPAGFPMMPFSFSFRGGFFRLGEFFHRIDRMVDKRNANLSVTGRLLTIEGIKLEPDSTGFPNVKATVKATSYLASPLEGATGGATPTGPAPTTGTTTPGTTPSTTPPTTSAAIR